MENLQRGDCGSAFVEDVLSQHPALFGELLANAPRFRFQVLLSVPADAPDGCASLVRHGYRVDDEYFYPASAIKMCAAVTAIQKLKRLQSSLGINVNCTTPVALYSLLEGIEDDRSDPSNINQKQITVAHEIRKIFLVSDNQAFNRLFSFIGHRTINEAMWDLGLQSTRLHRRLSESRTLAAIYSEPIDVDVAGTVFTLPPKCSGLILQDNSNLRGVKVGTAYIADDGQLVPQPMDFSKKNYMSMVDLQDLLIKLVRPDIEVDTPLLKLDAAMRTLLMEAMAQFPSQSANPKYDGADYPDDYCKFFLPGLSRIRPKGALRIYNKIGRAYGFTIDNSYVFDVETARSFFLTAVIYTNANEVLNDDRYEYEFADRALADLAEVLGRALWQIPSSSSSPLSSPLDCTPSSLWPPAIPTSNVKAHAVQQHSTDPLLISNAEKLSPSPQQPLVDTALEQTSPNLVPEQGAPCGAIADRGNSSCSPVLQHNTAKPVHMCTTSLPTSGDQPCNFCGDVQPMPVPQLSRYEAVSTLNPCYKYFMDE